MSVGAWLHGVHRNSTMKNSCFLYFINILNISHHYSSVYDSVVPDTAERETNLTKGRNPREGVLQYIKKERKKRTKTQLSGSLTLNVSGLTNIHLIF